jgi:hypothetical protein
MAKKKTRISQNFSIVNQSLQLKCYCQCQSQCEKMGLTEIQKQTIVQRDFDTGNCC